MKAAAEVGDFERVSDLQMEAAQLAARELQYVDRKAEIETQARRDQAKREAPVVPSDPIEAAVQGLSPQSAAWLRSHPDCITDDLQNAKVMVADKEAKRKGIPPDSSEYFAYIETQMGFRKADAETDDGDEVETKPEPKRMAPAAPVSRDGMRGSLSPDKVRLSREQVEVAEALGMAPADYAKWLVKAERDKKYANY
jgi:hypothetical protein